MVNKTGNPTSEQQSSLSFERLLHSVTCLISHCHDTQPLLFHLTHFCFIVLFHCGVTQNMEVPFLVCMSSSWFMISIFILCTGAKHLNTCFLFYGYLCHQLEIFPLCSSPSHGIILLNIVAFQPRNSRAFGCEGGSLKFKTLTLALYRTLSLSSCVLSKSCKMKPLWLFLSFSQVPSDRSIDLRSHVCITLLFVKFQLSIHYIIWDMGMCVGTWHEASEFGAKSDIKILAFFWWYWTMLVYKGMFGCTIFWWNCEGISGIVICITIWIGFCK